MSFFHICSLCYMRKRSSIDPNQEKIKIEGRGWDKERTSLGEGEISSCCWFTALICYPSTEISTPTAYQRLLSFSNRWSQQKPRRKKQVAMVTEQSRWHGSGISVLVNAATRQFTEHETAADKDIQNFTFPNSHSTMKPDLSYSTFPVCWEAWISCTKSMSEIW